MKFVNYLGIQMKVINEDTSSVTMRRADAENAEFDFVVMKDSARYRAMFPEANPQKLSLKAVLEPAKQTLESMDTRLFISKEGIWLDKANTPISQFIDSFIVDTTKYESAQEALQGIEAQVRADKTGILLYILATFAYQFYAGERLEVNTLNAEALARAAEGYKNQKYPQYHKDLLNAYLKFIDDSTPLKIKENELKDLCALFPRAEYGAECIMCFAGFAVCKDSDINYIVEPKQAQPLFTKLCEEFVCNTSK